jgi:uncharacterized protein DUF4382
MRRPSAVLPSAIALLALAACNGTTAPSMGQLNLHLTDAPLAGIASATVQITKAYLIGGGDASGPRFTITDTPQSYDLLTLQNGATALLGSASIPVGDYTQLRLVVGQATVTLASPLTFSDGSTSKTVKVPSGMETGIKVNFSGPVHIHPGQTDLVVDFDVSRNFVFTGGASSPTGVLFTPVLQASVMDVAGSISGTSSPAAALGHLFAIMTTSGGPDTVASALADATTGAYKLWYLPPGSYTVADTAVGYKNSTQSVTVGPAQNVTGVNFALAK